MKTVYVIIDVSFENILGNNYGCVFHSNTELCFHLNPVTCRYRVIDVECLVQFCL